MNTNGLAFGGKLERENLVTLFHVPSHVSLGMPTAREQVLRNREWQKVNERDEFSLPLIKLHGTASVEEPTAYEGLPHKFMKSDQRTARPVRWVRHPCFFRLKSSHFRTEPLSLLYPSGYSNAVYNCSVDEAHRPR